MPNITVIIDNHKDWNAYYPSKDVVLIDDYLAAQDVIERGSMIINLCRNYKYLSHGYYCSLLAESRRQKVIPSIRTINDLSKKPLYAENLETLNEALNRTTRKQELGEMARIKIRFFFGQSEHELLQEFGRQVFEAFPCPILEVEFLKNQVWAVVSIRPVGLNELEEREEDQFANAIDLFSKKIWRKPKGPKKFRYDMAILVNPDEALPPSNKGALKNFVFVGKELGVNVELIGRRDLAKLAEYDALFIRETTATNDHTYQFAKKAESEHMVVIDDPDSILRCTNKVFLANLLSSRKIATPRTAVLSRHHRKQVIEQCKPLGFPIVLKIPDGSFSRGIVKIETEQELEKEANNFFKNSALILAQEYCYTDYDWRVGILNGKALYACQYFMSKGHWQIYNHKNNGKVQAGNSATVPIHAVPKDVIKTALDAANLIGNGLYGVDLKKTAEKTIVIEVNDNPNIDAGVEDAVMGEELYIRIMSEFIRRMENKRLGLAS